jgi:hemin uptake protein HemP
MRIVSSDELLQGQRELLIAHAGQIYRLLRTRNDKLILHK